MNPWKLNTMRKIFTLILLLCAVTGFAQTYNNEWIKPSQTYYKFKIGSDGLYRIPQATLASLGLSATPVQQFQLYGFGWAAVAARGDECRLVAHGLPINHPVWSSRLQVIHDAHAQGPGQ